MADDIFDIEDTTEGDPSLERLVKMAQELVDQEQLIKDLEENLTTAKRVANKLKTTDLPDLMAEVGMVRRFRSKLSGFMPGASQR